MMGYTPYNAMGNSPVMYSDPEGDAIPLLALAVAGGFVRGAFAHEGGGSFYQGFAMGFGTSLATAGIGGIFGTVGSLGNELGRAAAHGLVGGFDSHLSGGSFGSGFLSSALSSGFGSALHGAGSLAQLAGSGLSGMAGSLVTGGNPWSGLGIGLTIGVLNHLSHIGDPIYDGGNLPAATVSARRVGTPNISYVTAAGSMIGSGLTAAGHQQYGAGTWRGANGKYYSTSWGGNGSTGARSLARFSSTALKATGTTFGVANYLGIGAQYANDQISAGQFVAELGSNTYTTFGGLPGVAWGIGWETGRMITTTKGYQNWKQKTWLPYRKRALGY